MPQVQTGRITPLVIRKAIQDKKNTLTDKEIFTSAAFNRMVETIGKYMTGRVKHPVTAAIVWDEAMDRSAYTNNEGIVVNAAHKSIQSLTTLYGRYCSIIGLVAHEYGHCLYSDFDLHAKLLDRIAAGSLPVTPVLTLENRNGLARFEEFIQTDDHSRYFAVQLYGQFDNLLDDVYVNRRVISNFPGSPGQCLSEHISQRNRKTSISSELSAISDEYGMDRISMWGLFSSAVYMHLQFNYVNWGSLRDPHLEEIRKRIAGLGKEIADGILDADSMTRKLAQTDLFVRNWDLIQRDMDAGAPLPVKDPMRESKYLPPSKKKRTRSDLEKLLQSLFPNAPFDISALDKDSDLQEDSSSTGRDPSSSEKKGSNSDKDSKQQSGKSNRPPKGEQDSGGKVVTANGDREPVEEKTSVQKGNEDTFGDIKSADAIKALNEMMQELAEEKAEREIENDHLSMLNKSAQESLDPTDKTDRTIIRVVRSSPSAEFKKRHAEIWPRLSEISKRTQKNLMEYLEELSEEETLGGQIFGSQLHSGSLCRKDHRYFQKRLDPIGAPELVVAIIKDRSYSMGEPAASRGRLNLFYSKSEAVSYTCLILYDFCVRLHIPVMVLGHNSGGLLSLQHKARFHVNLDVNASFERVDKNDRFRIMDTDCNEGNRDGTALSYALHELRKRPEQHKLLFTLSDGKPCAYSSEEAGIAHVKQVLKEARRHNIRVFSAALDEDVEKIKSIYSPDTGARCYEIADMMKLPLELMKLIKRYLM